MDDHDDQHIIERWSDEALLRAAQDGNQDAFRVFCVRTLPSLNRYLANQCRVRGIPRDLARDFAQETILKALAHVRMYSEECFSPPRLSAAWLFQIGYHVLVDWLRRHRSASKAQAEFLAIKSQRVDKERQDQREEVLKFYSWLTPTEQEMIELVLLEGLHPLDAGAKIGLSDAASYKAYERALQHLRDLIKEHSDMADRLFQK